MAAITRAQAEKILVHRRGTVLARVGLNGTTIDGTNADLADPIAYATRQLGLGVADPTNPQDADLAAIQPTDTDQFLEVAEWRVLASCLGNWGKVTQQAGTDKQQYTDLLTELRQQLSQKGEELKQQYGQGLMAPTAGSIDLDINTQDDTVTLGKLFN